MKDRTLKLNKYKREVIKLVAENEDARLVKNRLKVLSFILSQEYPSLLENYSKESLIEILRDVLYIDRQIRRETIEFDQEQKKILSQQWVVDNLL